MRRTATLLILLSVCHATAQEPELPPSPPAEEPALPAPEPFILEIEVLLDRAERLLDRTDRESVELASEMYGFALEIDPASPRALAGQARTQVVRYTRRWEVSEELLDSALESARRASELAPGDPGAHAALAWVLMAREDWDAAVDSADRAWTLRQESTPTWVDAVYAQSLLARWEREGALDVVHAALLRRPDRAALHALEGSILIELQRYADAILPLQRARLLEPEYAPALLRMGYARDRMGDHRMAALIYGKVVGQNPEEKGRVYLLRAVSLMGQGSYARALGGLERVTLPASRGLGEGTRLYFMAQCHERLGHLDAAERLYRDVIRDHPLSSFGSPTAGSAAVAAYESLARIALDRERLPEAARLLEEALELDRPTVDLYLNLADVHLQHGLPEQASRILARGASADLGRRLAGPKLRIFQQWGRLLESHEIPGAAVHRDEALNALQAHASAVRATGSEVWFVEAARASLLLGSADRALQWLREAVDLGYRKLEWIPEDPEMGVLSEHPQFTELLGRSRDI